MKNRSLTLAIGLMLLAWGTAGCSNRDVDVAKLQSSFQSADASTRAELDKGIAAISAGKFADALPPLRYVAYSTKLTKDQRVILEDSIKKVKARAAR